MRKKVVTSHLFTPLFMFIHGNLKYKYSVRRSAWHMTYSRLKLTWIDCSLNPVWKRIRFERAINCMQYMLIWQHFYIQHRRKLWLYISNCLIRRNSWWIWWYVHVEVQFESWIDRWMSSVLHSGIFSCVYLQYAQKPK